MQVEHLPVVNHTQIQGRMAEWSKALVLGTSHYGGAGSNPAPVIWNKLALIKRPACMASHFKTQSSYTTVKTGLMKSQ